MASQFVTTVLMMVVIFQTSVDAECKEVARSNDELAQSLPAGSAIQKRAAIDHPDCGQRPLAGTADGSEPFTVGAKEATPNSWPWTCSLQRFGSHICGGSLIKNKEGDYFFLTAAHCVSDSDFNAGSYLVRCGIHNLQSSAEPYEEFLDLKDLTRHPSYSSSTFRNDIAIMSLNSNPTETDGLFAVCLPASNAETDDGEYWYTGWGVFYPGGSPLTPVLNEVTMQIVSDDICDGTYGSFFYAPTMVCVSMYGTGGHAACQGISGSPLVAFRNGGWELVGVASWGYDCTQTANPGVYTDVYQMESWINSVIN
ncbi:hypothetical protein BaRGS_00017699 [Batillaria attramentaria]|uniref:Peptidase S1 domain-containing protein n=1 Tax=Batillaria attramentaria TaxID=370345 RepID=A0ABD0KUQ1_9CAEN